MTGEIEEPFTLDFRVDSFGSGSISFGRFEGEALCWERRSSFLHNRYLEEVEKCSKPGSVTEKKAYFEAHFRKKGFPVLGSPECPDDNFSKNDDEEIDHMNASSQFDQSLGGLDNKKLLKECETRVDDAELGTTLEIKFETENLDCETAYFTDDHVNEGVATVTQQASLPKKNNTSKPDHIKPRLVPRVSPAPSRRYTPSTTYKASIKKANDKARDDRVHSKAENKTSGDPHKHRLLHKTTKFEGGSETKGVDKINSGEREVRSRSRTIVEPQRSTSQKVSGKAYQSANRVKPAVGVSKPGTRQDISKSTTKEVVPSNIEARKKHAGSSTPGTRLSKSSQSGIEASSSAGSSKVKASEAAISRKKEGGKLASLGEGKQKTTRIERSSSYASFNRAGRMAVGLVS